MDHSAPTDSRLMLSDGRHERAGELRKADFIRRADAICRQTRDDIHEIETPMTLCESIPAKHEQIEEVREQERMIRGKYLSLTLSTS